MSLLARARLKEDVSPNLVPMIDVMFLLMLFFMLGADMSQRASAELALPVADQAREDRVELDASTITNVRHIDAPACAVHGSGGTCRELAHWTFSLRGLDLTLDELGRRLAAEAGEFPEARTAGEKDRPLSSRRLLVRADRAAPYGDVQLVLEAAARAGLYKVEAAALRPGPVLSR